MMKLVSVPKIKFDIDFRIYDYLNPDYIYLPINDNKVVNKKFKRFESVNDGVFSSVSGISKKIIDDKYLEIENDFKEISLINKNNINIDFNLDNLLLFFNNHKCCLHQEFNKKVENIVVNFIDQDYLFNNYSYFKIYTREILDTIEKITEVFKCKNNSLIFKNIDQEIIEEYLNINGSYPELKIVLENDFYLLDKKDFLLEHMNLFDKNTLYLTLNDILFIYYEYICGKKMDTKIITITGDAIRKGKVLRVKKYTKLSDILNEFIDILVEDFEVIKNSLMYGDILDFKNTIIDDDINGIFIMKKKVLTKHECVNCGYCNNICPVKINVLKSLKQSKKNIKCIRCGLCNYICPANIDIIKKITGGK